MTKQSKISETQQVVIRILTTHSKPLVRLPGGFWTYEGCHTEHNIRGYDVPDWYIDIKTIRAMENKGLLTRVHKYPEEWRDERILVRAA